MAVSVQGKVVELGPDKLPALFAKILTWKRFIWTNSRAVP